MVENNIETAKDLIIKEFYFLEELGYEPTFNILNDAPFIESAEVEYVNPTKKRGISITYHKSNIFEEIKYSFGLSITRHPYSNVFDLFALSLYLDSIGKDFPTSMINHFDKAEAENILREISNTTIEYGSNIINGIEWLDNYWPRW